MTNFLHISLQRAFEAADEFFMPKNIRNKANLGKKVPCTFLQMAQRLKAKMNCADKKKCELK